MRNFILFLESQTETLFEKNKKRRNENVKYERKKGKTTILFLSCR